MSKETFLLRGYLKWLYHSLELSRVVVDLGLQARLFWHDRI